MNFRRILSIGFIGLLVPGVVLANFNSSDRGTTAAPFLQLGAGAKAEGLGEAYSAVADDATALYWNPAALTRIPAKTSSVALMHTEYLASTFYDYGAYARNWDGVNALAGGIQYFSAGRITESDPNGFDTGSFNPYDVAVSFAYAHQFSIGSVGATIKYVRSEILHSAQTEAHDLGILSKPLLNDRLRLAATMTNLGGKLKFQEGSASLPLTFRTGASYQWTTHWLSSLDVVFPVDDDPALNAGTAYNWAISPAWSMALRAGVNTSSLQVTGGLAAISLGMGLEFKRMNVDYAFEPLGELGSAHRISVTFRFDPEKPILHPATELAPDGMMHPHREEEMMLRDHLND